MENSIPILTKKSFKFVAERNLKQYDTPRNLLLALTGELGELAEQFQWVDDHEELSILSIDKKDKIGQEIADLTIYLLRLAKKCGVSLRKELMRG